MKYEDWIASGYKRYEVSRDKQINKLADFLLQKRFDDVNGKKYHITVYCYDRTNYPPQYAEMFEDSPIGFMPTAHFSLGEDLPFFNVEMNGIESWAGDIEGVEAWFERLWVLFHRHYYEKWSEV